MFRIGIAKDEYDLFLIMKNLMEGVGTLGQQFITPFGGGTRGKLEGWAVTQPFLNEHLTLTCKLSDPNFRSAWDVVGSTIGDQIDVEGNEPYQTDSGEFNMYIDFDAANNWVIGDEILLKVVDTTTAGAGILNAAACKIGTRTQTVTATCNKEGSVNATAQVKDLTADHDVSVLIPYHRGLSGVVVRSSDLLTTYTLATDYTVQAATGGITALSTGAITDGQALKVTVSATQSPAEFTVVPSVSGGSVNYVEGTQYDQAWLQFTSNRVSLTVVADQWSVGDTMVIYTTENPLKTANQEWENLLTNTGAVQYHNGRLGENQILRCNWRGKGLSGNDDIFIGIERDGIVTNSKSWWSFQGYRNWQSLSGYYGSEGYTAACQRVTFHSEEVVYYISMDGRSVRGIVSSDGYDHCFYLGLYIPDEEPQFNPLPLVIGGSGYETTHATVGDSWNTSSVGNSNWWHSKNGAQGFKYLSRTGIWEWGYNDNSEGLPPHRELGVCMFPHSEGFMMNLRHNFDGSYTPFPCEIVRWNTEGHNQMGYMDGCFGVASYLANGSFIPRGTIIVGSDGKKYAVAVNVWRSGVAGEHFGLELK